MMTTTMMHGLCDAWAVVRFLAFRGNTLYVEIDVD